jgi:hypothetical protein
MALDASMGEMQLLLTANPTLQTNDGFPAQQRLDELTTLFATVNRAYRRIDLLW